MDYQINQQDNGSYQFISQQPFTCENGGAIAPLVLVYETYGQLTPAKDNVIVIHHALSTNSHVSSHRGNTAKGWWQAMVGPKLAIDTERFYVICINNLGSCFGSSSPASINPVSKKPYRLSFPAITINDMVRAQYLLLQHLGIPKVYAVIGNSMGAMLSLSWSVLFPDSVHKLISVSSCYRAYPVSIAYHCIQKEIIQLDPSWQQGYYDENPQLGLKIARKIGLVSYRDATELNTRFTQSNNICDYLEHNANKLAQQFDANCYLYLLDAMDNFDITRGYQDPLIPFSKIKAKTLILAVDSDVLFPPMQQQELHQHLKNAGVAVKFTQLHSPLGHDAFYNDENIGRHISDFLLSA